MNLAILTLFVLIGVQRRQLPVSLDSWRQQGGKRSEVVSHGFKHFGGFLAWGYPEKSKSLDQILALTPTSWW
jgi:hypothetical protein